MKGLRWSRGKLAVAVVAVWVLYVLYCTLSNGISLLRNADAPAPPTDVSTSFRWTIFTTPRGFEGSYDEVQQRAIQSWLRLEVGWGLHYLWL